jgi:hypothetical protein
MKGFPHGPSGPHSTVPQTTFRYDTSLSTYKSRKKKTRASSSSSHHTSFLILKLILSRARLSPSTKLPVLTYCTISIRRLENRKLQEQATCTVARIRQDPPRNSPAPTSKRAGLDKNPDSDGTARVSVPSAGTPLDRSERYSFTGRVGRQLLPCHVCLSVDRQGRSTVH